MATHVVATVWRSCFMSTGRCNDCIAPDSSAASVLVLVSALLEHYLVEVEPFDACIGCARSALDFATL